MRPSTSRYSTSAERDPATRPLAGPFGYALSVDVEEWYHTCWVEEWVDPARRPRLPEELDHLLPATLELLADCGAKATFFVLGEIARRLPERIREIQLAGHEVASHGEVHLRAEHWTAADFLEQAAGARAFLQDLTGTAVEGFRAPEWSLRHRRNPRLRALVEAGFSYDSSLSPCWGAGRRENPTSPYLLEWPDGSRIAEYPPLAFAGAARLPACGWTGRMAGARWLAAAARRAAAQGLALLTIHPWELVDRPVPGELSGLARLFHDVGRVGYRDRLRTLLSTLPWTSLAGTAVAVRQAAAGPSGAAAPAGRALPVGST